MGKKCFIILGIMFPLLAFAQEIQLDETKIEDDFLTPLVPQSVSDIQAPPAIEVKQEPTLDIHYSWTDFLTAKSCTEDLKQFQKISFLSNEQKYLKELMENYCTSGVSAWKKLLNIFRQGKKNLMIHSILSQDSSLIRYLKVIPYFLFDFHNMHPTDQTLASKLDKIQNAIQDKMPEQIIFLIQELSPNQQTFLVPLLNETNQLIDLKNALQGRE